jgi:hypothetical protein
MRGIIKEFWHTTWDIRMTPEGTFTVMWLGEPGDCPAYRMRCRLELLERHLTGEKFRDLPSLMGRAKEYASYLEFSRGTAGSRVR